MISHTITTLAALLAAQKVNHTVIRDSQPTIIIPVPNEAAIMIYHDPKLGGPAMIHSTHMPIPELVSHTERLSELLRHIVKEAKPKPSESLLEALVRKPEILALAWSE